MPPVSGPGGEVWHMQQMHGGALGLLAAAVIARGGLHGGVSREALHGGQVSPCREQVADEGPPEVVWREVLHPRLSGSSSQNMEHGLVAHALGLEVAASAYGPEQ